MQRRRAGRQRPADFILRPSTLGPNQHERFGRTFWRGFPNLGMSTWRKAQQYGAALASAFWREQVIECADWVNWRDLRAATLLRGRDRDSPPAIVRGARLPGARRHGDMRGRHRHNRRDAERGGIAYRVIHLIAFKQSECERHFDWRLRNRFDFRHEFDGRGGTAERRDAAEPLASRSVEDADVVAHAQSQHARQVMRVR